MRNDIKMTNIEQQALYVSPLVKTIEIMTLSIICQSGGNRGMGEENYGDGGFEEWN
ncbi:MAG: hypothetical protein MJY41_01525 [Bacteroidales bacterium]|nr:hypothetical protein [Bacteroidales bacterium]